MEERKMSFIFFSPIFFSEIEANRQLATTDGCDCAVLCRSATYLNRDKSMFRIKICGITNIDDAKAAIESGADALGLNFYRKSPRFIDSNAATRIIAVVPKNVTKVGLFVNESAEAVAATFDSLGLDLIQLHGDEPPEYLTQLGGRPVMKAFRLTTTGLPPIEAFLERATRNLSHILIDSHVEGTYGGTGTKPDWATCAKFVASRSGPALILAGGLTPDNVAEAIGQVRPAAVDTASGVETSPGRKDHRLIASFVENARRAFLSIRP
jgi:phosphoribosylanthranilate isomerase